MIINKAYGPTIIRKIEQAITHGQVADATCLR